MKWLCFLHVHRQGLLSSLPRPYKDQQSPGLEVLPIIQEYEARDPLGKLDAQKSMELDGRHSKVLIKLANTVVRPLLLLKGCDVRRSLDNWKIQILYPSSIRVRGGFGELKDGPPNFSLWDGYRTNQNKKFTLQNWRELLVYWSTSLSFIGILTNWRSTLEESSWISRKETWSLAPWEEYSHATELVWGLTGWKQACREEAEGLMDKLNGNQQCVLTANKVNLI